MNSDNQLDVVKDYYAKVLKTKNDLKTTACCSTEDIPAYLKSIVRDVHEEVRAKFYGCGVPVPPKLRNQVVLDLGSGSGRDCFVMSALVGDQGRVIGVDMTDEQLEVANKYRDFHAKAFGLSQSNVDFRKGYIEDLASLDIADQSVDVVVSNCVINLSPDKSRVFGEIMRVLKPGGELYFSDVFCDRRLSKVQRENDVLLGECLGGAMYFEDFRRVMSAHGVHDFRTVAKSEIFVTNDDVKKLTEPARFFSITIRAFKTELEDRCEDFGQFVRYKGTIPDFAAGFLLDDHHYFEKDRFLAVCGNTFDMLAQSRYAEDFEFVGDKSKHFGLFDCGSIEPGKESNAAASCC